VTRATASAKNPDKINYARAPPTTSGPGGRAVRVPDLGPKNVAIIDDPSVCQGIADAFREFT
jgi:hypothetical protein